MSFKYSTTSDSETNPLSYFSGRGKDYEKYRPVHPEPAIDTILEGLEPPTQLVAVDIGSGTGIGSRLLAQRGIRVLAIEPNIDMRASATPHELVEFFTGTAEQISLQTASVDLVVSFQAFHWFDFTKSLQEFRRILKPGGRLALVWSVWDQKDIISKRYSRLISEASKQHERRSRPRSQAQTLLKTLRYQMFWQGLWLPYFTDLQLHLFTYYQQLDLPGLIGLARSQGFIPQGGTELAKLVSEVSKFHKHFCDKHGQVQLAYCTRLYLATSSNNHE